MAHRQGSSVVGFSLDRCSAKRVTARLAEEDSSRIKLGSHSRQRMREHGVTIRQVFDVLRDRRSYVTEGPAMTAAGSWKFNLLGFSAGEVLELVLDMRGTEPDLSVQLVTVIVK